MHRVLAALTLVVALAVPLSASAAESTWEMLKEEWGYRPWAVIIAAPALLVTAPFMLGKYLVDKLEEAGDE